MILNIIKPNKAKSANVAKSADNWQLKRIVGGIRSISEMALVESGDDSIDCTDIDWMYPHDGSPAWIVEIKFKDDVARTAIFSEAYLMNDDGDTIEIWRYV